MFSFLLIKDFNWKLLAGKVRGRGTWKSELKNCNINTPNATKISVIWCLKLCFQREYSYNVHSKVYFLEKEVLSVVLYYMYYLTAVVTHSKFSSLLSTRYWFQCDTCQCRKGEKCCCLYLFHPELWVLWMTCWYHRETL